MVLADLCRGPTLLLGGLSSNLLFADEKLFKNISRF